MTKTRVYNTWVQSAVVLVLVLAAGMHAGMAGQPAQRLQLAHASNPQNAYARGAEHFAALITERSGGELVVEVYPNAQLGDQLDSIDNLTMGTIDFALVSTGVLGAYMHQVPVFDLPYLFRDREHAYAALDTVGMELCEASQEDRILVLAFWDNGFRHFTTDTRPIRTPDDVRGLRLRSMEQWASRATIRHLGGQPVPLTLGAVRGGLQDGSLNGQENSIGNIFTMEFYKYQKYLSLTGHIYAAEPLVMSSATWEGLSPAHREIVRTAALETRDWQRKLCQGLEDRFLHLLRDMKNFTVVDEVDRDAFARVTRPVWDNYIQRFGTETIDRILAIK